MLLAALAPAGCTPEVEPVDPEAIAQVLPTLHRPVYEVYGLPLERDAVWELLDGSFAGEALTQQYVEHWTTRHRMARESTSIDVRKVEYDAVNVLQRWPGHARVDVSWSVGGIVTHQRHKHPRVNRYRAVYTLEDTDRGWRIVQTRMRDLHRVKSPSRDGGVFDVLDAAPQEGGGYLDPLDLLDGGLGEDTGDSDVDPVAPVPAGSMDPFGALDATPEGEP